MNNYQDYFKIIRDNHLHHKVKSFEAYLQELYKNVDFKNKCVLEIGAGNGFHSFYAAYSGAKRVVAIEPESDGSRSGFLSDFKMNSQIFNVNSVVLFPGTLQEFDNANEKFDIIISHYSINHLNENACINLTKMPKAQDEYMVIFSKLHGLLSKKGQLVIVDCSNSNFFAKLGIKNPFSPSVEWNKHHHPNIWIGLLEKSGFKQKDIVWIPPYQFRKLGYLLLSNRLGGFFTHSHFAIFLEK